MCLIASAISFASLLLADPCLTIRLSRTISLWSIASGPLQRPPRAGAVSHGA